MFSLPRNTGFAAQLRFACTRSLTTTCPRQSRWSDLVKRTQETLKIEEISPSELQNELAKTEKPVVIDVRESNEWQTGKIPGAVCLSRGVLELGVEKVVQPESKRPIVLYCAGGMRSIMAAEALVRMGYNKDQLKSLKGGFAAWRKEGHHVESQ